MALAINIEDLLLKQKIESNRIEFKKGWNPASVYHSVCAFANDIDDLGGGYILIGVETDEHTGMAMRPVHGVPLEKIDKILREMVGYNNKMSPYYMPRTSVEEVDGKQILVIWCPAGINRPYSVPENITSKSKGKEYFYIRSGTSSIVARGEVLEELRELASRIPFDERGNPDIQIEDISTLLLREYLVKVGSKLANDLHTKPLQDILEQMDLYVGPKENHTLRNVAAMMFCENPSKFFKRTQVEVVFFPEGRVKDPNNLYEGPIITGSVTQIIERTLEYLRRMLIVQKVSKPKNNAHSTKCYSYPFQAIEESVTNSLYHRDYREWEPVVITIEPQGLTIQNVGGPDRSISSQDLSRCELLVSKRYRNRRLGEYLKELDLTEGRSTGIPTIQRELELNGSPRAVVTTDDDRTYFRITIPCHQDFGNIIADVAHKDSLQRKRTEVAPKNSPKSAPKKSPKSAPKNSSKHPLTKGEVRSNGSPKSAPKYTLRKSWDLNQKAVYIIGKNQRVTISEMAEAIGVSRRSILKATNKLQEEGVIRRVGPNKGGHWEVVK